MKTILCYGDSNTWGAPPITTWPVTRIPRYGPDTRWGSVLRSSLGVDYWVVEEGLSGRTTIWNDPIEGEFLNGKTYLLPCLKSHAPLDLVALMLGTNDLKHRYGLSAWDIAAGVGTLVDIIQRSECGPDGTAPQVLLICPPPLARLTIFAEMLAGGTEKSQQLASYYQQVAQDHGCAFLDARQVIRTSDLDGVHFDPDQQRKLGQVVADKVKTMLTGR